MSCRACTGSCCGVYNVRMCGGVTGLVSVCGVCVGVRVGMGVSVRVVSGSGYVRVVCVCVC